MIPILAGRAGVDCDGPHRHAPRHELAGRIGAGSLQAGRARRRPLCVPWHKQQADQDPSRWAGHVALCQELERGRFLWPSPADGVVTITPAQIAPDRAGVF